MEAGSFGCNLSYLSHSCIAFSLEERINLGLSLKKLKETIKSEELLFWGKIKGLLS